MSSIDSERHDASVVVTLNNPDAFNVLAPNKSGDFVAAMRDAAASRNLIRPACSASAAAFSAVVVSKV